ncbi:hypothetical protein M0M57_00930 [Flavobacterium azooxidireducens]|uniref:Uncharacterized protein n=1 Tax=Flavobacterium azooxidireducens TaxID=1871076 RepID=A0ABY4KIA0_9FLAO|nr:hypothetical protein [Flavobacterium azooxidireducens]UPQ79418.1 hypothetical protein M0M57_00930 [Flavobacterium azooxidireducens]
MQHKEDLIWDNITNSAKRKFDYKDFESSFEEIDIELADTFLFEIIAGFAGGESKELISARLLSQIMLTGFHFDKTEMHKFIDGKEKVLGIEIYATQLARTMLEDGTDVISVLKSINQILN